jgi:hypothetical protein
VYKIAEKLDAVFDKEWAKVTKSLAKIQERSGGGPTGIKLSLHPPKTNVEPATPPAPAAAAPKVSLKLKTSSMRVTPQEQSPAPPAPSRPILKLKASTADSSSTPKKLKIDGGKKDKEKEKALAPVVALAPTIPPLPNAPLVDLRQYDSDPINYKKAKAVLNQMNKSEYSFFFRAPVDAASAPGYVQSLFFFLFYLSVL